MLSEAISGVLAMAGLALGAAGMAIMLRAAASAMLGGWRCKRSKE